MNFKTFAITTLGCKVNQYESALIESQLSGMKMVGFGECADLCIINTCGVTAEAEAKTRQLIRRARRLSPDSLLVLTGCWDVGQTVRLSDLGVDVFIRNDQKAEFLKNLSPDFTPGENLERMRFPSFRKSRVYIKVQDGCDETCAFCAVPIFRSRLKSRDAESIIAEVRHQVANGALEIVVTGVNLGKYGVDLSDKPDLTSLLKELFDKTTIARVRLSSIEPNEISDDLINLFAMEPRLARHLHVPIQSGSDSVLSRMQRKYTIQQFAALNDRIRSRIPDFSITTDIIVGFPGEADADFHDTLDVIKDFCFSRLHVFKFSKRPNTRAATMSDQVDPAVKKERANATKALGSQLEANFARRFVNKEISVLVERKQADDQSGLTGEYVRVKFKRAIDFSNSIVTAVGLTTEKNILLVKER